MLILSGESPANSLVFTPDGTRLIVGRGHGYVEVFSLPSGERLHRWDRFGTFISLAVHSSGRFVFVGSETSLAVVPLDGSKLRNGAPTVHRVIASSNGAWVVVQEYRRQSVTGLSCNADGELRAVWELQPDHYKLCSFVGDNNCFVTVERLDINIRDAATGKVQSTVRCPSQHASTSAASSDGSQFAVMGYDKLYVWDTAKWGKPARLPCAGGRRFSSFAFHPTKPLFAAIQGEQTLVKFYDTVNWKLTARFQWKLGALRSVAFSPDGTLAAGGSVGGQIVVWDVDA